MNNTPEKDWYVEFKNKKQELKDWLYGTVYKQYDTEETAEVVQQDVEDHFSDKWFEEIISHVESTAFAKGQRDMAKFLRKEIETTAYHRNGLGEIVGGLYQTGSEKMRGPRTEELELINKVSLLEFIDGFIN